MAPWKFDVLKTSIFVLRSSNFRGATISRQLLDRNTLLFKQNALGRLSGKQLSTTVFFRQHENNLLSHVDFSQKRATEVFFRLKTAENYDTVKRKVGGEVSRFEVSSLEGFFFRSQQSGSSDITLFIHLQMQYHLKRIQRKIRNT